MSAENTTNTGAQEAENAEKYAVEVKNVTKIYRLYDKPIDRLKESLSVSHKEYHKDFYALSDLSFTVEKGQTVGIIGTGKIAKKLIMILRGFGMNVLAYDLYPDYNFARQEQIVYTSLDELYHNSDIISLHCPLTEETKYLINDYSISKMKDGVMIINTGRGQLIHTNALIEGLKNKKIGSAGLDVYEEESEYFYEDQSDRIIDDDVLARLLSFNNVIVTSHQAFFTHEAMENIAATTLQNIKDFINHKPLLNEVKK